MKLLVPLALLAVGVAAVIDSDVVVDSKAIFRVRHPSKRIEQLRVLSEFLSAAPKKPDVDHVVVDGDSRSAPDVRVERFPDEVPLEMQPYRTTVTNENAKRRKRAFFEPSNEALPSNSVASSPRAQVFFEDTASPASSSPASESAFIPLTASRASPVESHLRQMPLNPTRTDNIVPYDAHIDPDFPREAPYARGIYNIPEGHNLDKDIDVEFRTGFRHGPFRPTQMTPGQFYIPRTAYSPVAKPSYSNKQYGYSPYAYSYPVSSHLTPV
ncbi:hypothetical protein QR680_009448 [Steinernema hermaphroditum]|uniref:Uncharacterized protein n=1 Tax=Steinernema hermaphroditum TaxID=289476 RepID=A0AA39IKB4_9BILA|nr:hypothetical protein QR680_009448 [Steinernema hermaphroditum]